MTTHQNVSVGATLSFALWKIANNIDSLLESVQL